MSNYKAIEATEKMMAILGEELIILKEELREGMDNRSFSDVIKTAIRLNKYANNGYDLLSKGADHFRFKKRVVEEFFDLVEHDLLLNGVSLKRIPSGTIEFYREDSKMGTLYSDNTVVFLTLSAEKQLEEQLEKLKGEQKEKSNQIISLSEEDKKMQTVLDCIVANKSVSDVLEPRHLELAYLDEFFLSDWFKEKVRQNENNWIGKQYRRLAMKIITRQLKKEKVRNNIFNRKVKRFKLSEHLRNQRISINLPISRTKIMMEPKIIKEREFKVLLEKYDIPYTHN